MSSVGLCVCVGSCGLHDGDEDGERTFIKNCLKLGQTVEEVSHVHASRDMEVSIVFMGVPEMFVALRGLGLIRFDRLTSNPSLPLLKNCRAQATKMMAQFNDLQCPVPLLFERRTGARAAARQRKQDGWTMLDMVGAMVSLPRKYRNRDQEPIERSSQEFFCVDTTKYCQDMTYILRSDASGSIASSSWETCRDAP